MRRPVENSNHWSRNIFWLHSLYFIHVSEPIPCVAWLARYSHHFSFGNKLFPPSSMFSSLCFFRPGQTGRKRGNCTHRSSSVSLTPSPRASLLIVSLLFFRQSLRRPLMVRSRTASSRHVVPRPSFLVRAYSMALVVCTGRCTKLSTCPRIWLSEPLSILRLG